MPALPTGTITFLVTDIAGSTALRDRDREAMQAALALHDRWLRAAVEARDGRVFKTVGDAFCAAFAGAGDAVEASVARRPHVDRREPGPAVPHARRALAQRSQVHAGAASRQGDHSTGRAGNQAGRAVAASPLTP